MWLRDSANQLQSYQSLVTLSSNDDSLAALYRGVINLQARYLLTSPYCQSFQPPAESGISPALNGAGNGDQVEPPYSDTDVFECKFELDSLAAFLEVSTNYYLATNDSAFFARFQWIHAVRAIMNIANSMMTPTYAANGSVNTSPYTFQRITRSSTDTLPNSGAGNPVQSGIRLVRSGFRPSDDACIYPLFVPANAMFSHYLSTTAKIVTAIGAHNRLADRMTSMSHSLRTAINTHGVVDNPVHGKIYAYEVDGFGSRNLMDDANIPSCCPCPCLTTHTPATQCIKRPAASFFLVEIRTTHAARSSTLLAVLTLDPATHGPWHRSCTS